jgi:hypothetical protein
VQVSCTPSAVRAPRPHRHYLIGSNWAGRRTFECFARTASVLATAVGLFSSFPFSPPLTTPFIRPTTSFFFLGMYSRFARRRPVLGRRRESHNSSPVQATLARQSPRVYQCGTARVVPLACRHGGDHGLHTTIERRGCAHAAVRRGRRGLDLPFRSRTRGTQLWPAARRACIGWYTKGRAARHWARVSLKSLPSRRKYFYKE